MSSLDLANCAREPIHIPGAIQPHGVLLALRPADLTVVAASGNLSSIAGTEAAAAVGAPAASILDAASLERVRFRAGQAGSAAGRPFPVRFLGGPDTPWDGLLHRHDGLAILEAESPPGDGVGEPPFSAVSATIDRMQATQDTALLCAEAVQGVRRLTGFDRVKLYRFHPDWSGEVVAEERAEHMPAYLGLMFPPSDIPAQARALYEINPDRLIPDAGYTPVPLLGGGEPIDLSHAQLRSVSPIHLHYLANMGVGASMSISVLRRGQLWGLIACHHAKPHRVGPQRRQACRLLAQVLAWQLASADELAIARHSVLVRALQTRVLLDSAEGKDHREVLQRHSQDLMGLTGASGFALVTPEAVTLAGATPDQAAVRDLAGWIAEQTESTTFETDRLGEAHPPAAAYADVASGAMAVPLSRPPRQMMLWFRPEAARTVTWGGEPGKVTERMADGTERLAPRQSFAAWQEQVRGRSWPWQPHEVVAAGELRDLVLNVLVRRAEELERMNERLARSNEELEAFAYIASHDIREPLRQIETFSGMLEHALNSAPISEVPRLVRWLDGIEASARRLRQLIDDLTEYSRLGRNAQPLGPVSLDAVLEEARSDVMQALLESGADLVVEGSLPTVLGDATQLRQVLQNMLANAVKYRHAGRPPRIVLAASDADTPGMVRLTISDNGIGFEQRHATRIFEPFQRLHGPDSYPGSGIGLAICRKIVTRHGGRIGAKGMPGEGAQFWLTLPVPAAPEAG